MTDPAGPDVDGGGVGGLVFGDGPREERRPRRRRRWLVLGLLVVLVLAAVLAVLGVRLAGVEPQARAARNELALAADALRGQDTQAAQRHVAAARERLDRSRSTADGFAGDAWSWVPLAGSAVDDLRHLLSALDRTARVADVATTVYPQLTRKRSVDRLLQQDRVDVRRIARLLSQVRPAIDDLQQARSDIRAVTGDAPVIGDRLAAFRDQAATRIEPLAAAADRLEPAVTAVPELFGAGGSKRYLIAFLNPSELRWSGGAPLSFSTMTIADGRLSFGETISTDSPLLDRINGSTWEGVEGNPFHPPNRRRFQKATFNPDWAVSGEELLRAFERNNPARYDGLVAVDVPGIALLMGSAGGVSVPEVGRVTAANVTRTLVGSYDRYPTQDARRALNRAVAEVFRQRFLGGGNVSAKVAAIGQAASRRHLAVYARGEELQRAVVAMGLSGELADTEQDYLGVFSRETNDSKADFWQRRTVRSVVRLDEAGSARVKVRVTLRNVAPPYVPQPGFPTDPGRGYYTRLLHTRVLTVLPQGATRVRVNAPEVSWSGGAEDGELGDGKPFVTAPVELPRGATSGFDVTYTVPKAAVRDGDTLTYRFAFDPQGMTTDPRLSLRLRAPDGWRVERVPPGWRSTDTGATYGRRPTAGSQQWEVVLTRG